ncbi:MAG: paraquat-inducible protein B [Oceanicoccus sp.]|jgi:paraquat-inducible protein B
MNNNNLAAVEERPNSSFSAIWILPVIAAMFAGWLIYKSFMEAPIEITVSFDSGDGIVAGKTEVIYEGVVLGKVQTVKIKPELIGIFAILEMDRRTESVLRTNTEFWLVKPEISLSGIRGLSTVLSGNYITLRPGDGKPTSMFQSLPEPPPKSLTDPGLHLSLQSTDLGSISVGSPIRYKKFDIGDVQSFELNKDGTGVNIDIFIKPEFIHLVHKKSRFWNASGVTIRGDLTGFDISTDSLTTIFKGGIGLTEVDLGKEKIALAAENGDRFSLHQDFVSAQAGIFIAVKFPLSQGIVEDVTPVMYRGIKVGQIGNVIISEDLLTMETEMFIDPRYDDYLNSKTRIWEGSRSFSLQDISGFNKLLTGSYVEIDFDGGPPEQVLALTALAYPPILKKDAEGLHIKLKLDSLKSITRGTKISYRNVPVGSVLDYQFNEKSDGILVSVHIESNYAHLVNASSRFWNSSGIEIEGGINGLKVRTASLNSILLGGIGFYTPNSKAVKASNGQSFRLYKDYENAHLNGTPITLYFDDGDGLKVGTIIKYEGIDVGEVRSVRLNEALDGVIVKALLREGAADVARVGTQFWMVKPQIGLAKVSNIGTLLTGQYITFRLGEGEPSYNFEGLIEEPLSKKDREGLNIIVTAPRLGSVKEDAPIFFRQIQVGRVTGYRLADSADHVRMYLNVEKKYASLVRKNTKFWNASGVDIGFKLFGGATIKTESLESILAGGIAFATPDSELPQEPGKLASEAVENDEFVLHASREEYWLLWQPIIELAE